MPTIVDVARQAGVSIATVSRVQRGTARVRPETRDRVLAAVADLRYMPSQLGRALAEGRHGASGIVFPDLSGPYYSEVILGYEEAAAEARQSVLILGTHGRPARELVLDLAGRVDGLVLFGRTVDDDLVEQLAGAGMPVVLLARPPAASADTVRSESKRSAAVMARHLAGHGHRRIAFLGDPSASPDAGERWRGLRAGLKRSGIEPPNKPVLSSFREADGYAVAGDVLDRSAAERPTALVCANDEIALGAYGAALERDLAIPDDVAITGWDDIPTARFVSPGLTTVRQPMRALGARAAAALNERIRGERTSPRHEVLPTSLVIRASCGCISGKEVGDQ